MFWDRTQITKQWQLQWVGRVQRLQRGFWIESFVLNSEWSLYWIFIWRLYRQMEKRNDKSLYDTLIGGEFRTVVYIVISMGFRCNIGKPATTDPPVDSARSRHSSANRREQEWYTCTLQSSAVHNIDSDRFPNCCWPRGMQRLFIQYPGEPLTFIAGLHEVRAIVVHPSPLISSADLIECNLTSSVSGFMVKSSNNLGPLSRYADNPSRWISASPIGLEQISVVYIQRIERFPSKLNKLLIR